MMSVSATAARARLRQVVHQLTVAERAALAVAAILGVAAIGAIHADAAGREWPDVATALIAAGLGASLLAAGIGWAIVGSATALARRVDLAAIKGDRALDEAREMRRCLDGVQHAVQLLVQRQREADAGRIDDILRAVIAEIERIRMAERDREAMAAELSMAMERATRALAKERAQAARLHAALTRQRRAHEAALEAVIRRYRAELDRMAVDSKAAERRAREEGRAEGRAEGFAEGYAHGVSRRQSQTGES